MPKHTPKKRVTNRERWQAIRDAMAKEDREEMEAIEAHWGWGDTGVGLAARRGPNTDKEMLEARDAFMLKYHVPPRYLEENTDMIRYVRKKGLLPE